MRRAVATAALLLAAAAGGVVWWRIPPVPRHVIVVSIDTLRADQIHPYGNAEAVTPTLDRIAAEGVVFEQDVSVAPTTLVSHTSMFSGRFPHTHGAPRNDFEVNADNLMLAEVLADAGFQTAAFLGAVPLASHSGFPQGFEVVDETFTDHRREGVAQTERSATQVTDAVLSWLGGRDDARPLFLFVHYFDVHAPYDPPPRWRDHYAPDAPPAAGSLPHIARTRAQLRSGKPAGAEQAALLEKLYLGGVSYVDEELGRLLDGLRRDGVLDDAVLVVTADHGETFDTHEELFDHGLTVYDETVHVPLLVRMPDGWRGGRRIPEQVASLDLFASLLDLLGREIPPNEGTSWLPLLRGDLFPAPRPPAFSEATKPHVGHNPGWQNDPMAKAVRKDGWKYVSVPRDGSSHLFRIPEDPGELTDRVGQGEPVEAGLAADLEAWRQQADPLPTRQVTQARVRAELAALGYLDEEDDRGEGRHAREAQDTDQR